MSWSTSLVVSATRRQEVRSDVSANHLPTNRMLTVPDDDEHVAVGEAVDDKTQHVLLGDRQRDRVVRGA